MFLKNKKFCIIALMILIIIPCITNYAYFSQECMEISFKNILKLNFTKFPLIIVNLFCIIIAGLLCSIKKIFTDMETLDKIEEELKPYKLLLENSPAIVVQADKKGYFKYVNEAFEKISGYSRDEVIGKMHISAFYKGGMETAKKVLKIMRTTAKGGIGKIIDYRLILLTRYNEEIPAAIFGTIVYIKGKEDSTIGFLFDNRERLQLENELIASKEKYKRLIENAGEGIYIRQEHQFKYVNKKFKEMLGYADDEEVQNIPIFEVIDENAFKTCSILYNRILKGEKVKMPYESIFKKKNGEKIYVEITINNVEFEGKPAVQGFVRDITDKKALDEKLKKMNEKLLELSNRDGLTGLYNYRYFREKLRERYLESVRYKIPLSIMVIDIDDFKKINDTYGHLAGDMVLKELAKILTLNVREVDIVARYGGEEFVILLPHVNLRDTEVIANRILKQVEAKEFIYDLNVIRATISIGVSSIHDKPVKDENELLKYADEALYLVKNSGKNRVYAMDAATIN